MEHYLHNMKKTCAEFDLLGFRGKGYFFDPNRLVKVTKGITGGKNEIRLKRLYYGLIINASNVTHSMKDIYTGEPLYKSDKDDNEILQKLYENIHEEIDRNALVRHGNPEQVINAKNRLETTPRGNWFDNVWNKYVVGDGNIAELYSKGAREYSYIDDMNPKLAALVNAYNEDNSVGKMDTADIIAKFGISTIYIVAFRRWLKTKL